MTLPLINPEPSLHFDLPSATVIPFPCHVRAMQIELADAEFQLEHRRDWFGDRPDLQTDELAERVAELRSRVRAVKP